MDMPISSITKLFTTEIIEQKATITQKKTVKKKTSDENLNFEIESLTKKVEEVEQKRKLLQLKE